MEYVIKHSGDLRNEVNPTEGVVELSDAEVRELVNLMVKEGTENVYQLDLREKCPEVFYKLDSAYRKLARFVNEVEELRMAYGNHWLEYDVDEVMADCEKNCGFRFESDKVFANAVELYEERVRVFKAWLDKYVGSLSDRDFVDFCYICLGTSFVADPIAAEDYEVKIPQAIIEMAQEEEGGR